jgi:hypothetical protein
MRKNMILTVSALYGTLLLPSNATGQGMPVYDNTNFISMTKSLIESAKQTSELLKTAQFLKEQKENLVKVNNVIRELRAARELSRNHQRLFSTVQRDLREVLSSPYIRPQEAQQITQTIEELLTTASQDLELINHILSSDFLKMTDAERTGILLEKEAQSRELASEITRKTERFRDIIAFRRMQDRINNREPVQ